MVAVWSRAGYPLHSLRWIVSARYPCPSPERSITFALLSTQTPPKDSDDFLLQADNLDVDEFDDELNDETFGDPIGDLNDDWEAAQDQYNGRQTVHTCPHGAHKQAKRCPQDTNRQTLESNPIQSEF